MCFSETISWVSKGTTFTKGPLFVSMVKTPSVVVVVTDSHVLRGSTLQRSELRQGHIATSDVCSLGRATSCHNRTAAQKPL